MWRKANPNFGLSVKADDLARKAEKAIALPGAQNAFRRMHLNEWTEQAERWIDMAAWDACDAPVDLDQLRGRACFGGLDLSTTSVLATGPRSVITRYTVTGSGMFLTRCSPIGSKPNATLLLTWL